MMRAFEGRAGPVTDGPIDSEDIPMSLRAKIVAGVIVAVLIVAAAYLMLRMSSPVIPAGATPPAGHFAADCTICHRIGAAASSVTP
jgi:hypothetical protein